MRYFKIRLSPTISHGVSRDELKELNIHFTRFLKNSDLHYFELYLRVKGNTNKSDWVEGFKYIPDHIQKN